MNTFILSPLQESIAQCGAGKHDQWRVCVTIRIINHGIIKSISIVTAVFCLIIKSNLDTPWDYFRQQGKWMLTIW